MLGSLSVSNRVVGTTGVTLSFTLYTVQQAVASGDYLYIKLPGSEDIGFDETNSPTCLATPLVVTECLIMSPTEAKITL